MRWHCPLDTGFEIRALVVWGRACYPSVTEAPHNFESFQVTREDTFLIYIFEAWRPEWDSNPWSPTFQAGSFSHCTRASAEEGAMTNPFDCYVIVLSIESSIIWAVTLTLSSRNLPLSSSFTTSRELLSQFSTCSGWRWFDVVKKLKKIAMCW